MRTKLAASTLILILFTASFVFGQSWDHTKGIGLTGSLFKFVGGNVDRAAPGNLGGISLKYGLSPNLLLDLGMNYGSFKPTVEGKRFKADENAPYRTFLFPIVLELKATPTPDASLKPYGFVGAGLLAWDLRDESGVDKSFFKDQEFVWGKSIYGETKYNTLFQIRAGLETFLTQSLAGSSSWRFSFSVCSPKR